MIQQRCTINTAICVYTTVCTLVFSADTSFLTDFQCDNSLHKPTELGLQDVVDDSEMFIVYTWV